MNPDSDGASWPEFMDVRFGPDSDRRVAYAVFHSTETNSILVAVTTDSSLARRYVSAMKSQGHDGYYAAMFQLLTESDVQAIENNPSS